MQQNSDTNSEDLEKVINPTGTKKFWNVKDVISNRQDRTRNTIAIFMIVSYLVITIILIFLGVIGKCGQNGVNCNSIMYSAFSALVGVVIGFYFNMKN